MGETLNGVAGLDIDAEKKVVEEKLNELRADGATEEAITSAMKDLGLERLAQSLISCFFEINSLLYGLT